MEERSSLLFVDPEDAGLYLPALRTRFEVTVVSTGSQALRALRAYRPTLVVTELALPEGDGATICRQSKVYSENAPAVLAVTSVPDLVPDALAAGCDGVLVKPFAPNLLFARIGLLLKQRSTALIRRAVWQRAKSEYLVARSHLMMGGGTNITVHDARCPSCGQAGVVRFDAVSRGRSWYACIPCRKAWIGVSAAAGGASRTPGTAPPPAAASG
jgi:CheY-like chemotaxis protein